MVNHSQIYVALYAVRRKNIGRLRLGLERTYQCSSVRRAPFICRPKRRRQKSRSSRSISAIIDTTIIATMASIESSIERSQLENDGNPPGWQDNWIDFLHRHHVRTYRANCFIKPIDRRWYPAVATAVSANSGAYRLR